MRPIIRVWSKAPFIRLLIPLIAGIILQWNIQCELIFLSLSFIICFAFIILYFFLSLKTKYRFSVLHGLFINFMILLAGAILTWLNDVRHEPQWIGHEGKDSNYIIAQLEEPLVEKQNSYKALASVQYSDTKDKPKPAKGQIIIYFKKDSSITVLNYGSRIVFNKSLQEIKNAGNPGSFDYKKYSLFQGTTHQVYLTPNEFVLLPGEHKSFFKDFIFRCRHWVLEKLRRSIPGEKELGLAEALLIGYKDDLDKNLVQSYSNTGVVHVIAISGLHLGLIYWLLLMLTRPLSKNKSAAWIRLLLVISCIWWFSILAGAQPSVLRSAVMFSFLAAAEVLSRRSSIYNTLALSAFVLLCYNPFWLWDAGFQLSYAAVLSIIIFFRPIYNWLYFKNKLLDGIWKLNAVTMAAQLLTLPISIYHFHQVPTLFLFTNLVAVPLSSIILIGEITLCVLFFIDPLAKFSGMILQWMIWLMNTYIERLDQVPFSTWQGLSINMIQAILLTCFIMIFCSWLMENKRLLMWLSAGCLFLFISIHSYRVIITTQQKKLIVYNVPKRQAIDLISGNEYCYIGDAVLINDEKLRNFHIAPSRILHRLAVKQNKPSSTAFVFCNKRILMVNSNLNLKLLTVKEPLDLLILSGNPKLYIAHLTHGFTIGRVIIDASVPQWKAKLWKRDCDSLHIPYYDVSEEGAFVMNL